MADFHLIPGDHPERESALQPGELITGVRLPALAGFAQSRYLKVRDRQSYAFALVSVAAGLEISSKTIQSAGLALGGVAHKPWHSPEAEKFLIGTVVSPDAFRKAAELALAGAKPQEHNAFKVELAKQSIVRTLTLAAQGVQA